MERPGHVGGALLLYFGILYVIGWRGDALETAALALIAALIAAAMSVKPDVDQAFFGIFHRTWVTHSLVTVLAATGIAYFVFTCLLYAGRFSLYITIAVFSATLSHVLLDSLTRGGVPVFGPLDDKKRGLRWFKSNDMWLNWAFLTLGVAMAALYFGIIHI